ncbi:T6SS effector BTH_I2691 family protein [Burkholderia sp. BCC1977]|uniref:T6SS effector BTH_I2691 family protein n=2 Tax=unclassified Burkholderia TaxID=2613784 RepID=UPI002ABD38F3|nr:T6SS effector BTH_I2691 family protein [Burkholderia sp. BCC1977]
MPTTKGCPLCDRQSLLIYPVRYAIACPRGASKAPALSGNFRIDGRAPQAVATAKYTLRALRPGYLYTYDEKRKKLAAYMVLDDGIMWNFPPDVTPPPGDAENALTQGCAMNGDLAFESFGRCVSVEHTPGSDEATNLWIGWSNVRWTKDLVHNKINDAAWRKQHMQCINVSAMLAGGATDTGEFQATQSKIAHFAMDAQAMKAAFGFSNRAPKDEIRLRQRNVAKRIGDAMAESPNKKGFVVAVNDPVGLTNDLAELTVPNLNNGFDEQVYWKWTSAQLLGRAEAGIRANAKAVTGLTYGTSKTIADANAVNMKVGAPIAPDAIGFFHVMRSWIRTGSLEQAMKEEDRKTENVPATQEEAANEAWEDAAFKVGPDGKRTSVLDEEALKRFPQEYQQALEAFKPKWQPLVQAHADWLKSQLLAEWMAGVHDSQDLRSGYAYSESCAQVIGSAVGTEPCKKALDDWLNGQASNIRNLYVRALMFNQDTLMKSADAQVHGSDIQYENFLNLYKEAFKKIENLGNAANLRDRLIVTTANQIVGVLTKATRGAALGFVTIRLAIQSGVRLKPSQVSKLAIRDWALQQARELGVKLDGNRTEQRASATQVGKQVLKTAPPSDPNVVAYEMDVDALVRDGKLEASAIKAVRVPGVDTAKKWLGSAREFNLGVVTVIFQMATLTFAAKDWADSDQFSQGETGLKAVGAVVSIVGTVIETASETVAKAPAHPLSAFIMKQWAGASEWAEVGAKVGRGLGALAGIVLAGYDIFKNMPEAYANKEYGLTTLYAFSGVLGVYVAVAAFFSLPLFWPALVLSILVGIAIAIFKASALKDWVSRSKFSKGEHYDSLEAELKAFNSAAGG